MSIALLLLTSITNSAFAETVMLRVRNIKFILKLTMKNLKRAHMENIAVGIVLGQELMREILFIGAIIKYTYSQDQRNQHIQKYT